VKLGLSPKEKRKDRVFRNKVLRRTHEPKRGINMKMEKIP